MEGLSFRTSIYMIILLLHSQRRLWSTSPNSPCFFVTRNMLQQNKEKIRIVLEEDLRVTSPHQHVVCLHQVNGRNERSRSCFIYCMVGYVVGSHSHCLMSGEWKLRGSVFRSKASTCKAGFVQSLMKFTRKTKAMLINSP